MADEKLSCSAQNKEASNQEVREEMALSYSMAKKLLPFLAKRGIPASPKNYRIFYDYLMFTNPELNKTVNDLLDNNAKFYCQLSASIYDRFYSGEVTEHQAQAIGKAATDFISISSSMEQSLESAISKTNHYQKVLTDTSKNMAGLTTADQLQPYLEELLTETEAALASNDSFFARISEANSIIANLKAELENQTNLAQVDELTKLYNRRHLNQTAPTLIAQAAALGRPVSAIVFDLDFFKKINDTWGHHFGDKVLVLCAEIIRGTARNGVDLPVRMGGEEFLLLCSGLNLAGAARVAERVRLAIAETQITIRGSNLPVTISCGVAQHTAGEDLTNFIDRADKALYRAKQDGRNRVRLAEIETGETDGDSLQPC